jgi:hypothetical protein
MTSVTQKVSESIGKVSEYNCLKCGYITCIKSNYTKHCLTARHNNVTVRTIGDIKVSKSITPYSCSNCKKNYKSRNGLWQHNKKCSHKTKILEEDEEVLENPTIDTNLIIKLIQQNEKLQNLLVQQAADHSQKQSELINKLVVREPLNNTVNNINTTNNNNQKFNLNFFLNETCKDAMNIQDFIENIRITFQDLLKIGDSGFVNGMSDIFVKQLQNIEVTKRPIHCTDSKRDTIYFKEENTWNKDDKENNKLKGIIEKVEYKNVAALREWCNENPDSKVNNTNNNVLRDKIYLQTLQGDDNTRDKIIKNISKEVIVDKE